MEARKRNPVDRARWLEAALVMLRERGVGGVKIVPLAKELGLTSGSFYWHFKDVQDLLDAILEHWESHLTQHIIKDAQAFTGPPGERIFNLMRQVVEEDAAGPDPAISVWAKANHSAREAFERTLEARFGFAAWMFEQAGFAPDEARARGRLMVSYLMGESSGLLKSDPDWEEVLRRQWAVLMKP